MRLNSFINANRVERFNRIMELSGFYRFDDRGEGAYIMNIINAYPYYRTEAAAALDKALGSCPTAELEKLDVFDIRMAPEIR
jgi:hypothetical protein